MGKEKVKSISIEGDNNKIFNEPVYNPVFCDSGSNVTIQFVGKESEPKVTGKTADKMPEDREKLKAKVLNDITKRFKFSDEQLGTANGKRITNDQVIGLFKQCFGIGSNPKYEWKEVIEQVWGLLIDKRKLCSKEEGEDFFRPTVLNVLGYFRQKGVLKGETKELMKAVFEDAKDGQAKNLIRGEYHPEKVNQEAYQLPLKFIEVMDYYIDNIMGKR